MKKLIFCITAILFFTVNLNAQICEHETLVELSNVLELTIPNDSTKTVVLDPITSEVKYTFFNDLLKSKSTYYTTFLGQYAGLNDEKIQTINTGIGWQSLMLNVSGSYNSALGHRTLENNLASYNTALGAFALYANTIGSSNVAVGSIALRENTEGTGNTAIGFSALNANTIGNSNTSVGFGNLSNNITGSANTTIGYQALNTSENSSNNASLGAFTLKNINSGSNNLAIGYRSGYFLNDGVSHLTSANQSVFLGAKTSAENNNSLNETVIGYNAEGKGDNTVVIGNSIVTDTYLKGNVHGVIKTHTFEGLYVMSTDNRWVSNDAFLGTSSSSFNQSHGTGITPSVIWYSMGALDLPQGAVLKKITIFGRTNSTEVTSLNAHISVQGDANYNSIATADNTEVLTQLTLIHPSNNTTVFNTWDINLNNYVLTKNRVIVICLRPNGTLTSQHNLYSRVKIEYLLN